MSTVSGTVDNEIHPLRVGEIACGGEIALKGSEIRQNAERVDFISPNASAFDFNNGANC